MDIIKDIENEQLEKLTAERPVPDFGPGDTLRISVKVVEGSRERTQIFEGVCIGRKNAGLNSAFTVRKISYGEGVERVFPLYSPAIAGIEVIRRGDVRRAKLYYLRGRTGKRARITEKSEWGTAKAKDAAEAAEAAEATDAEAAEAPPPAEKPKKEKKKKEKKKEAKVEVPETGEAEALTEEAVEAAKEEERAKEKDEKAEIEEKPAEKAEKKPAKKKAKKAAKAEDGGKEDATKADKKAKKEKKDKE